ncbi:MAG TPA: orotidine-5'-phosphate decarboxylase [Saprospiraceae bacterium]|nr:orotidine-5'-phosphate decarboxylase [Saprospiraceae bacterium]HMP23429.1 orotidine-5'-phosphate decarboxylase [Saprospiraceae bacterium]
MTRQELFACIQERQSFLCIGLDTDLSRIPQHLHTTNDPIFEFNRQIIDATRDLCVAYKPNLAFYEALGTAGWQALEKTIRYIGKEHFIIADAKRGDIGNTARLYAEAFFTQLKADAVTVAPYMGEDSVQPFLGFPGKWVILLALTSNAGSQDFQLLPQTSGQPLYEAVMRAAMRWSTPDTLMFVIGATHPERFREIRTIAPEHFFLVPGVGAQGGDLAAISQYGLNAQCGLLVNASRSIIYASHGEDFAERARAEALAIQKEMAILLQKYQLL